VRCRLIPLQLGHRWKQERLLVPAISKTSEQLSAADKLATVIHSVALSGTDLATLKFALP
jgi:hypothetical protein